MERTQFTKSLTTDLSKSNSKRKAEFLLIWCCENQCRIIAQNPDDASSDDVLYVGMSRARDKLVVVAEPKLIKKLKKMNRVGQPTDETGTSL